MSPIFQLFYIIFTCYRSPISYEPTCGRLVEIQHSLSLGNISYGYIDLPSPLVLSRRKPYCYGKEIVLLWRYCSLFECTLRRVEKQIFFHSRPIIFYKVRQCHFSFFLCAKTLVYVSKSCEVFVGIVCSYFSQQ